MNSIEIVFYALPGIEWLELTGAEQPTGQIINSQGQYRARVEATSQTSKKFNRPYLRVEARLPFEVRWGDSFQIKFSGCELPAPLRVIYPGAGQIKKIKSEERFIKWLDRYADGEEAMLLALTEEAGLKGLREPEMEAFCRLPSSELSRLAMNLEKRGKLFILEFSPLFLLSQKSFDFLAGKIMSFVETYHQRRPAETGPSIKKVKERFRLPKPVLLLALNRLLKDGQLEISGEHIQRQGFETSLSKEEGEIMRAIEKMLLEQKFSASSLEELARKFKVHPSRLETIVELLLQKRKIVESQEGFILHASWLEEIKKQLAERKRNGQEELTVGEFKEITGLSRKYAIPLLEFLDELGLTRRLGSKRVII
ncbi:MAG TPA: SelB C-terminal domain-containing protein [Candidatus Saccharicenans sp.]|jgi:selenocysteine-specific elongation factor|nr:SelB C-terminal domain-containing protein [Candidatus Saccharicenans sp.]HRD02883.1 SelB C-terminal domain-containing protein [Candidatus Saccharicenans sp.]